MRLDRDKPVPLNARLGRPRRGRFGVRRLGLTALMLGLGGAAFLAGNGNLAAPGKLASAGIQSARAAVPSYHADCSASPALLQTEISRIADGFDGKVGIAVAKAGCDWLAGARMTDYFPQQSVSKLWVSLTVLDAIDAGRLKFDQPVTIHPRDLTLFNQPLRAEVLEKGSVTRPVVELMRNAMSLSDNTANDRLLWTVGGPGKVRALLTAKGIEGIRFGPGERLLQSRVAGLVWSQDLALGRNFEQARARLPGEARAAALQRYVADPIDGATPAGMVRALARLATGELASPGATAVLLDIMAHSRSGPRRLKGGVPPGWKVYHKTGTGQELGGLATGYNDVAIFEAPDGTFYTVAVLVGETRRPIPERMELMHAVSAAVTDFHAQS